MRLFIPLFNEFWGGDEIVHVLCEKFPDFEYPSNFRFMSVNNGVWPRDLWATGVREYIRTLQSQNIVLLLDDYLLTRHVDRTAVHLLSDYMTKDDNILRMDLSADRLYARGNPINADDIDTCKYIDIISVDGTSYQMSLQCGIFNIRLLSSVLQDGLNPWEVELHTQPILDAANMKVYGTRQVPVRYINALGTGTPEGSVNLKGIKPSIVERALYNNWIPNSFSILRE